MLFLALLVCAGENSGVRLEAIPILVLLMNQRLVCSFISVSPIQELIAPMTPMLGPLKPSESAGFRTPGSVTTEASCMTDLSMSSSLSVDAARTPSTIFKSVHVVDGAQLVLETVHHLLLRAGTWITTPELMWSVRMLVTRLPILWSTVSPSK